MHAFYTTLQPLLQAQAQVGASFTSNPIVSMIITAVAFIAMLVVLVFIHELGHFVVALWMKIRVDEFGIGYPPKAVTLFERNGVKYTLNWIPLGGFVRFAGEDNSVYGAGSLAEAHPWKKIPVMAAGPLMNLLLAIVVFAILFATVGIPTPMEGQQRIGVVFEDTPAGKAGFQENDLIVSLDGQTIVDGDEIGEIGSSNEGKTLSAVVLRDGEEVTLQVTPGPWSLPSGQSFESGFGFSYGPDIEMVPVNPLMAIVASFAHTIEILVRMMVGLASLIGGLFRIVEPPAGGVAGPIGIARATGEIIEQGGMVGFLRWTALLSINLFVINMLPIPALDGSHIVFSLVEWVRGGKKVPPEKEALVHAIGFAALMGLILLVSVSDVIRAIQGNPVLGG